MPVKKKKKVTPPKKKATPPKKKVAPKKKKKETFGAKYEARVGHTGMGVRG